MGHSIEGNISVIKNSALRLNFNWALRIWHKKTGLECLVLPVMTKLFHRREKRWCSRPFATRRSKVLDPTTTSFPSDPRPNCRSHSPVTWWDKHTFYTSSIEKSRSFCTNNYFREKLLHTIVFAELKQIIILELQNSTFDMKLWPQASKSWA